MGGKTTHKLSSKNTYHIQDVVDRSDILIHVGNWTKDTYGCVLIGMGFKVDNKSVMITNSTSAMNKLRQVAGVGSFQNKHKGLVLCQRLKIFCQKLRWWQRLINPAYGVGMAIVEKLFIKPKKKAEIMLEGKKTYIGILIAVMPAVAGWFGYEVSATFSRRR